MKWKWIQWNLQEYLILVKTLVICFNKRWTRQLISARTTALSGNLGNSGLNRRPWEKSQTAGSVWWQTNPVNNLSFRCINHTVLKDFLWPVFSCCLIAFFDNQPQAYLWPDFFCRLYEIKQKNRNKVLSLDLTCFSLPFSGIYSQRTWWQRLSVLWVPAPHFTSPPLYLPSLSVFPDHLCLAWIVH